MRINLDWNKKVRILGCYAALYYASFHYCMSDIYLFDDVFRVMQILSRM